LQYIIFWDAGLTPNSMFNYHQTAEKYPFTFGPGQNSIGLRYGYIMPDAPEPNEEAQFFPDPLAFLPEVFDNKNGGSNAFLRI
jgi:hypothetical protein